MAPQGRLHPSNPVRPMLRRLSRPHRAPVVNPEQERRALIAGHIQRLTTNLEWDAYKSELLDMEHRVLEGLATAPKETIEHQQGVLQGIRDVLRLPTRLMAQGRRG